MIRYEKLTVPETIYPYEDAVSADTYKNGTFGDVVDGVFTAGEGFKTIMQIEKGNDMKTDKFVVQKDEHVRVADLSKTPGQVVNVTADELPETYEKGDKLVAGADGKLVVGSGDKYLEVIEPTRYGVRATIVA